MVEKIPKISVIIPAFNAQRWIEEAVKSALEQTLPPFEVIVVDDGSTDNTAQVIKKFGLRIKLLQQPNMGPASARNLGMKNAQGDWLAFLDADDKWLPWKLEKVMRIAEKNPDMGFFSHDAFVIDAQGKIVGTYRYKKSPAEHQALALLFRNTVMTSSVVMKSAVIKGIGFFNDNLCAGSEDWDYWIRVAEKYKLFHINECLAFYRRLEGSSSRVRLDKLLADNIAVVRDAGKRNQFPQAILNRAIANLYRDSAIRRASAFDSEGTRRDIAKAVELSGWQVKDFLLHSVQFLPRSMRKKLLDIKRFADRKKALKIARLLGITHE